MGVGHTRTAMLLMKFGGSSVANRQQIQKVLEIVQTNRSHTAMVVCSAHRGITNALVKAARSAAAGHLQSEEVIAKQQAIAEELSCPSGLLNELYDQLRSFLHGIYLMRELSPRSLAEVSSFGERMSVLCIANYFSRHQLDATAFDAWELGFITNDDYDAARPCPTFPELAQKAYQSKVSPACIPVVTGFIGKNSAGDITTVGRNGSDLTASLFAAALQLDEVQIWTDTNGVMTADPSVVSDAQNIPRMRFDEASELAYFGSRVLHPSTLLPAIDNNIPVRVLNTNRPDQAGTVIRETLSDEPRDEEERQVTSKATSIAYKEKQTVVTVHSTQMFGKAGYLAGIFSLLSRHNIIVDMLSTSEVSLSFTTEQLELVRSIEADLAEFGNIEIVPHKTILAVVGKHLPQRPGLGTQILTAMSQAAVNVEMISYGRKSINFSMLIDDHDIAIVVPILHKMLFQGEETPS